MAIYSELNDIFVEREHVVTVQTTQRFYPAVWNTKGGLYHCCILEVDLKQVTCR